MNITPDERYDNIVSQLSNGSTLNSPDQNYLLALAAVSTISHAAEAEAQTPVPEYGTPPQETVPSRAVHKNAPEVILFSFTEDANLVESYRAALVDTLMPYGYRVVAVTQSGKTVSVRAVRSVSGTVDA